jgi:hypothetical protein
VLDAKEAVPIVGAKGINETTIELLAELAVDVPLALVAVTVYVVVPEVVSVTIIGLDAPVFEAPDEDVTV